MPVRTVIPTPPRLRCPAPPLEDPVDGKAIVYNYEGMAGALYLCRESVAAVKLYLKTLGDKHGEADH